jgi:hypothetical protein
MCSEKCAKISIHRKQITWYTCQNDAWGKASRAASYPGTLMHDFRRTAAARLDSTPAISHSVAMTLLSHKTDIMFRRYIQRHDERLVEAAKALAENRVVKLAHDKSEAHRQQFRSTEDLDYETRRDKILMESSVGGGRGPGPHQSSKHVRETTLCNAALPC